MAIEGMSAMERPMSADGKQLLLERAPGPRPLGRPVTDPGKSIAGIVS
jgi:hypothetical protein